MGNVFTKKNQNKDIKKEKTDIVQVTTILHGTTTSTHEYSNENTKELSESNDLKKNSQNECNEMADLEIKLLKKMKKKKRKKPKEINTTIIHTNLYTKKEREKRKKKKTRGKCSNIDMYDDDINYIDNNII